ncbi:MAG TPA: PfkB family carbohydrate kinase [Anaeromyxobacteraceae bacterium]|nr:PfkB family carbohydrate kinase [Anaeromyxobacteraceae bacterium]
MRRPEAVHATAHLAGLVGRLAGVEVVVVGDFVADEYVYGETDRISREAPVLIVRFERSELKPGAAGNAAQNLAALGVRVRAVGLVGDDALGETLVGALAASGVDVAALQRIRGRATESKTRILAGGRSTRRQQMLRVDRAPAEPLPASAEPKLVRELLRAAKGARAVLASDYGSGAIGSAALQALQDLQGSGLPVCVDSRYRLVEYTGLGLLKPNEPELEAATGISVKAPGGLERAARALLRRSGCESLLVTRGRNGMSLFRKGAPALHIPPHGAADVVDVTGAGDTVAATYTASIAAGASPEDAARLANVAGALVVQKAGTATVSREELLAAVAQG